MLGSDHPDTAASLNNLAFVLRHQGDLAGARPLFDQGEGAQPRHSDTHLPCETLLRTCFRGSGNWDRALKRIQAPAAR